MNAHKTWIEISREKLKNNLREVKKRVGREVKILAIVKANAYGHGLEEVATILKDQVDWFGVDSIEDAIFIRKLKINKPILVMGFIPVERLKEAADQDISVVFYNNEFFRDINEIVFNRPLKIHLKIETGMNRQGIKEKDLEKFLEEMKKYTDQIILEGAYTHFSDPEDLDSTDLQYENFLKNLKTLKQCGFENLVKHVSASAGILVDEKYHLNLVRAGICLYGYLPYSRPKSEANMLDIKPVLSWKSLVAQTKFVEKNDFVGYGRTWQAKNRTRIAIIPVGYYDGFDRRFSNNARVLIKGKFANVIGRVAMNMFMVDISKIPGLEVGDEVVLIGNQGNNFIGADDLAHKISTINHEILSRINPNTFKVVV